MKKHKPIRLNVMGKTLEMQGEDAELILQALQIEKMLREGAVKEAEILRAEKAEILAGLRELQSTCPCDPDITHAFWDANKKASDLFAKYGKPEIETPKLIMP